MKSIKLLAVLGVFGGLLAGCASLPPMEMTRDNYVKAPVYVADLSFEKFKRPEKWETDAEWNKHVEAWQKQFREGVKRRFDKALPLDENAKSGMIVRAYVTNINRGYIHMVGGADYIMIQAEYYDAADKQKIGQTNYTADSSGAGWAQYSFGGRIGECSTIAGRTLGSILKKNQ